MVLDNLKIYILYSLGLLIWKKNYSVISDNVNDLYPFRISTAVVMTSHDLSNLLGLSVSIRSKNPAKIKDIYIYVEKKKKDILYAELGYESSFYANQP